MKLKMKIVKKDTNSIFFGSLKILKKGSVSCVSEYPSSVLKPVRDRLGVLYGCVV